MFKTMIACFVGLVVSSQTPIFAKVLFFDSFENKTMYATNTDGFRWEGNNRTSLVIQHPVDGSVEVFNNGQVYNIQPGNNWTAKTGGVSLRFHYPANEPWAEQRFNLGQPQTDLWVSFWIRVPENYLHTVDGGPCNNKFFSLWMDGYEAKGSGSTFWLSMESAGNGNTNLAFTYSLGNYTGSIAMQQKTPFIDAKKDRLKWMHIVFHVKAESSEGADDGVIETWRKWEGKLYLKLHGKRDVGFRVPATTEGFKSGYILGWANGEYLQDTTWLVDDFKISTSSLLE